MIISWNRGVITLALLASLTIWLPRFARCEALEGESGSEELAFMEIGDVYSAAKRWQEIKDAPASVTVISDDDIKKYGYRNLSDALRNVSDFYITNDRNYEQLGVRGITHLGGHGNLLLELVDGHTYNDGVYGSFFLGNEFGIDIDLIKRIEVVRGPGSALYGSNALLGVVNVITKKGEDVGGLYVKSETGSYDTYKGGVIYGNKFAGGLDVICAGSILESGGQDLHFKEFDNFGASHGRVSGADGEEAWNGFIKASLGEVSLTAASHLRDKNVPTAAYGTTFGDDRFETTDRRSFLEGKWDHPLGDDKSLELRAYYDDYAYIGRYPYDSPPAALNKDETASERAGAEMKYSQKLWASNLMTLGAEASSYYTSEQKNYDVNGATYLDDNHPFNTWSAYAQDEWSVFPWLRIVAGFRFDYFTTFGAETSPRAGLILQPTRDNVVKLLYGQAFRAPNLYELYYNDGGATQLANPDLRPETLHSYEAIWEHEFSSVWKSTAGVFRYEVQDLIAPVDVGTAGVLRFENINSVTANGLQAGLEANFPSVVKASLSYSYQDVTDDATGGWLPNSPRHLAKVKFVFPVYRDKVFLAALCRYMSERRTRDNGETGQNTVADLSLYARDFVKGYERLEVSLQVLNLFDERYSDPVSIEHRQQSIEQNGRNFWLKVSYLF